MFDYFYIELRGDGCSIGQATKFAVCILRMSWRCPFFVFDPVHHTPHVHSCREGAVREN